MVLTNINADADPTSHDATYHEYGADENYEIPDFPYHYGAESSVAPPVFHPIPEFPGIPGDENDESFQPENDAIPDDYLSGGLPERPPMEPAFINSIIRAPFAAPPAVPANPVPHEPQEPPRYLPHGRL